MALKRRKDSYMAGKQRWFAIKAEICNPRAHVFVFNAQKTMYGGKNVAVGDTVFIFACENEHGQGLVARGVVTKRNDVPRTAAIRQTPRISMSVARNGSAKRSLGRTELRVFRGRSDDAPEVEIYFKFYRQATNKIVALTDTAGEFLNGFF